jgi:alkylation response protein AidB-like acyl-CoA dehydrogenase
MWVTNGLLSGVVFAARQDRQRRRPALQGHDLLRLREGAGAPRTRRDAGLTVPPQIKKMGYKGVESTELVFDGYSAPPT